jgi:hypothetical protein
VELHLKEKHSLGCAHHPYYAGIVAIYSNEKATDKKMVIQTILIEITRQSCAMTSLHSCLLDKVNSLD